MSLPDSSGSKRQRVPAKTEGSPAPPEPRSVDISDSLPDAAGILRYATSVSISHKSPEQLAHDQEMERMKELNKQKTDREEKAYRREIDRRNWWTGIVVSGVITAVALAVMFLPGATEDTRKWAFGYLFAIFTYWMGYKGGSATKEPPKPSE